MVNSWEKAWIYPNLVLPRRWLAPKAHSALGSFALNSVASAWLGANACLSLPLVALTRPHPEQPPTLGKHSPWLTPYLTLRGAPIIPQELVPHLITVGNTWPFLQWEEVEREEKERKWRDREGKRRGARGEREKKTSISSLDLKNHNISKAREPPVGSANETKILSPGDILKQESERVCCGKRGNVRGFVCVCVCILEFQCGLGESESSDTIAKAPLSL